MLDQVYFDNSVKQYLSALGLFVVVLWGFVAGRRILISRLRWLAQQTDTRLDDIIVDLLEMIRSPECYLVAFYAATRPLLLPGWLDRGFRSAVILVVSYRVVTMLQRLARFLVTQALFKGGEDDAGRRHTVRTISYLINVVIWIGAATFVLGNLGFNVSSMIAGLGIGGIAVALAAQAVLGDLFAAVAIYLDQPFVIGDAITFGDTTGTVERIGFKTTRLRALSGELLIVPNSVLAASKIQNWRHIHERRVVVAFGVSYDTKPESLERLPSEVRRLIETAGGDKVRVDRVHLKGLGESTIDYEAVYSVLSPDYNVYMDIGQCFHLALLEHLAKHGIELPFPTRKVVLGKTA